MKTTTRCSLGLATLVGLAIPSSVLADEPTAADIAQAALDRNTLGFDGHRIKARLVLVDADGRRDERAFEVVSKRDADGALKSVIRFSAPAAVAGTAVLMIQHRDAPDEQYIYLSRLKSTRRIAAGNERDASFMGSDFTYGDLERKDAKDATYERLADADIGRDSCFHIVSHPLRSSAYSKLELWIRKSDNIPLRVQMFDKSGALQKTVFTRRIGVVDGKPVVLESHTENALTRHQTDLVVDDLSTQADLSDGLFMPGSLAH